MTPSTNHDSEFPYRRAVGFLMYLMLATRPDICYSVSYLSRFLDKPERQNSVDVKRVFKYLNGTRNLGLSYRSGRDAREILGFCDADLRIVIRKAGLSLVIVFIIMAIW